MRHSLENLPYRAIRNGPDLTSGTDGGVLILDKPEDITSMDAVNYVRRIYRTQQVGHTGTLDPIATGVLVMLVGRAVKVCEYTTGENKRYKASLRLGVTTDSGDITGQTLSVHEGALPSADEVKAAAASLIGERDQLPPMLSAVRVNGRRLYEIAREGGEIERRARRIRIDSIGVEPGDTDADYTLDISCSGGTFIRTVCTEIGDILGCGGTMSTLRRIGAGDFDISQAHTIEQLASMTDEELISLLRPAESVLTGCEKLTLPDFFGSLARHGNRIYLKKIRKSYPVGTRLRLCDSKGFFALGEVREYDDGTAVKPIKAFWTEKTQDGAAK